MWETVLDIKYEDFELDNEDMIILKDLIIQFTKNLQNQYEELCGSFLDPVYTVKGQFCTVMDR